MHGVPFHQFWRTIELFIFKYFSFAPCKVIALNCYCVIFGFSSFLDILSIVANFAIVVVLKGNSNSFFSHFAIERTIWKS